MQRARVLRLVPLAAIAVHGCGRERDAAPSPAPRVESPPAAPTVDTPPEPSKAPPSKAPPAPTPTHDDWLIWVVRDDLSTTRWIDADADPSARVVAERSALIVGEGAQLWRIAREDGEIDVRSCACARAETDPGCTTTGRITSFGLRAHGLAGARGGAMIVPTTEAMIATDAETRLRIVGGVGPRLLYTVEESGDFCGPHGLLAHKTVVFDLIAGAPDSEALATTAAALPMALRTEAATAIRDALVACKQRGELELVRDRSMTLAGLEVALRGGAPELRWHFAADAPYACAGDNLVHGDVTTTLVPEAAALQLTPDLPAAVTEVLAGLGEADAVGWGHLQWAGDRRDAAIELFRSASDTAWPSAIAIPHASGESPAPPPSDELARAQRMLRIRNEPAAIAIFDRILARTPDDVTALAGRGHARVQAGRLDEAAGDLARALELADSDSRRADIVFDQGQLAERRGDLAGAQTAYDAALALDARPEIQAAIDRVRKARR